MGQLHKNPSLGNNTLQDTVMKLTCLVLVTLASVVCGQFILPNKRACANRKVHLERHGKKYHFSWLEVGENRKFTWEQARNYCRRFCMDAISIQSVAEYNTVKEQLRKNRLRYIWTGGRKCNFRGCDRPDLQPTIVNGHQLEAPADPNQTIVKAVKEVRMRAALLF